MANPTFPILGTEIPPMLARSSIMHRLWTDLTKPVPSNLSIIGPRFVGKTVIMNDLVKRVSTSQSPYKFVLYWHLGHVSPESDDEFVSELCTLLQSSLAKAQVDTSEYRMHLEERTFGNLSEVIELLDERKMPILMLWDGFDKPLGQGKLTGQLWDQMRTLFYGKKHKIVTATRKPLSNLIRSQDAITSPFWNIFDMNPVRIAVFDDSDCEVILAKLSQYTFDKGAITEIMNWSSGFPPLFLELVNQLVVENASGSIKNDAIDRAGGKASEKLNVLISDMWQDCPSPAQDIFIHIIDRGGLPRTDVDKHEVSCLIEKGFVKIVNNKLIASCRMLQEHIKGAKQNTDSMARLFKSWDDYKNNMRNLLERRLAHISRFDNRLYRLVERSIDDIPDYPDDCLNNLTGIRDCALELIWKNELGTDKRIPMPAVEHWTSYPRSKHYLVKQMMESDCWDLPAKILDQIRILQLLTGSFPDFESKAKNTTKNTYVLLDAIHTFRNLAQHPDGQRIDVGVAVAAIMTCLELLACLERELQL